MVVTWPRAEPSCRSAKILQAGAGFQQRVHCFALFCLAWMRLLSSYPSGKVFAKSKMISRPLGRCLLIAWVLDSSLMHPTARACLPSPRVPFQKITPWLLGLPREGAHCTMGVGTRSRARLAGELEREGKTLELTLELLQLGWSWISLAAPSSEEAFLRWPLQTFWCYLIKLSDAFLKKPPWAFSRMLPTRES